MIRDFTDIEQASIAAVEHITAIAQSAAAAKGFFTIVLAGGSTPQRMYQLLGEPAYADIMPWLQCHFFWGDERWVDPTHPDSNFAMANRTFLAKVHIPPGHIHRIPTDQASPAVGAAIYEKHLRDFFASKSVPKTSDIEKSKPFPDFDLILLGMGEDGHTASLFPASDLLAEKKKWVAAVPAGSGSPPVARITLTLPVLNRAKNILFLIAGSQKRKILNTIIRKPEEAATLYPAARIKPAGNLYWLAASSV